MNGGITSQYLLNQQPKKHLYLMNLYYSSSKLKYKKDYEGYSFPSNCRK